MQNLYFSERDKYLKNKKVDFIIDKMPLNIIHVGEILRFFPNAKFIFALRNPYDCVLSCFMQQFDLNPAMKNFLSIEASANLYDLVMKLWKIYKNKFRLIPDYLLDLLHPNSRDKNQRFQVATICRKQGSHVNQKFEIPPLFFLELEYQKLTYH